MPGGFLNRTFKFRAWDFNKKSLVQVQQLNADQAYLLIFTQGSHLLGQVSDFHLMQYTNLRDHKGQEIYEGDVIAVYASYLEKKGFILCKVIFEEGAFVVATFYDDEYKTTRKIIEPLSALVKTDKQGNRRCFGDIIGHIYEPGEILTERTKTLLKSREHHPLE